MELIKRQAAIDTIAHATFNVTIDGRRGFQNYKEEFERAFVAIRDEYIKALKAVPSAEPEIIRCMDCKHWGKRGLCEKWDHYISNDDFYCGCAERRNDGADARPDIG